MNLRETTHPVWQGRFRPALNGQGVFPRPHQPRLPLWVGVGGTPESFARAGLLGLPLMVAIIDGTFERFRTASVEAAAMKRSIELLGGEVARSFGAAFPPNEPNLQRAAPHVFLDRAQSSRASADFHPSKRKIDPDNGNTNDARWHPPHRRAGEPT